MNLLVLLLLAAGDGSAPRKPSAIAPSLPALTSEEEARIERAIGRFILADTGRLKGPEARAAIAEFEALKPEAIPALIRGLNRAAKDNQTCPVLMISKKLSRLLLSSDDPQLLDFARDEIGADGADRSRYGNTLKDLRVRVMLRRNALARATPPRPAERGPAQMSTAELAKAASVERGEKLRGVVRELGKRAGKEALAGLTVAANSYETEVQELARAAMDASLGRLRAAAVAAHLEDENVEVRRSAVRVAAAKHTGLIPKVIDRLDDDSAEVRAEALAALRALNKGEDFGPSAGASQAERREAKRKWLQWWEDLRK